MLDLLLNLLYAAIGIVCLYYGAEFLVRGGSAAARRAGVSPLVIGLTLVAFATSAPELVISISAALENNADISLGNIVGSNIFNIAFILGVCACVTPISVQKQLLRFDSLIMLGSAVLLTLFYFHSHGLSRIQGAVLLVGLIAYTGWSIYASRRESGRQAQEAGSSADAPPAAPAPMPVWAAWLLVAAGLGILVLGAKTFLWSAVYFAGLLHLSDAVIGLTIVAAGTSLPELATSVVAAIRKENDIAIGNVLGSNIFNILGILGVTPLIRPLTNATLDMVDLGMMLAVSAILLPMMRSGWKISRKEGFLLLLACTGYTFYLISSHT